MPGKYPEGSVGMYTDDVVVLKSIVSIRSAIHGLCCLRRRLFTLGDVGHLFREESLKFCVYLKLFFNFFLHWKFSARIPCQKWLPSYLKMPYDCFLKIILILRIFLNDKLPYEEFPISGVNIQESVDFAKNECWHGCSGALLLRHDLQRPQLRKSPNSAGAQVTCVESLERR